MSASENLATQTGVGKVFVSYSRTDSAFAEKLVSGLELCGFHAYLDKYDIAPGESWEDRLGGLIRGADTVVYVLSPSSVASKHCVWEVAETVRLSKRLLPIVRQDVPHDEVPKLLGKPNWIFFYRRRLLHQKPRRAGQRSESQSRMDPPSHALRRTGGKLGGKGKARRPSSS